MKIILEFCGGQTREELKPITISSVGGSGALGNTHTYVDRYMKGGQEATELKRTVQAVRERGHNDVCEFLGCCISISRWNHWIFRSHKLRFSGQCRHVPLKSSLMPLWCFRFLGTDPENTDELTLVIIGVYTIQPRKRIISIEGSVTCMSWKWGWRM